MLYLEFYMYSPQTHEEQLIRLDESEYTRDWLIGFFENMDREDIWDTNIDD